MHDSRVVQRHRVSEGKYRDKYSHRYFISRCNISCNLTIVAFIARRDHARPRRSGRSTFTRELNPRFYALYMHNLFVRSRV